MRRLVLALSTILVALPLHAGGAQIIRGGRFNLRDPQTWASAMIGWQEGWTVTDGASGARWQFGDTQAYGLSLERAVRSGITLGVRGTTSQPTMNFESTSTGAVRAADARVSQALGVVHVTTGRDLRSVFELGVGSTFYSSLRDRVTGQDLGASGTDTDFAFTFTYGLGYSFSRNLHVDVVQDLGTSLHQSTGLAAGEDRSARVRSTRLVARYGFGG